MRTALLSPQIQDLVAHTNPAPRKIEHDFVRSCVPGGSRIRGNFLATSLSTGSSQPSSAQKAVLEAL